MAFYDYWANPPKWKFTWQLSNEAIAKIIAAVFIGGLLGWRGWKKRKKK